MAFGQVTDRGVRLRIDADGDELAQVPVFADHTERGVASTDELPGRLGDPPQDDR